MSKIKYPRKESGMKKCSKCKNFKNVLEFSSDSTNKTDGLQGKCKKCVIEINELKRKKYDNLDENIVKKICKDCNEEKLIKFFNRASTGRLGRRNDCQICQNILKRKKIIKKQLEGTKICYKCKINKHVNQFDADIYGSKGLQSYCKKCRIDIDCKSLSKYDNFIRNLFQDLKTRAKKKRLQLTISIDDIKNLYIKQNKKCAITGQKLTHVKKKRDTIQHIINKWNISVDRIDSSVGYILDNIQLVGAIINRMKYTLNHNDFINLCHLIVNKSDDCIEPSFDDNYIEKFINLKYIWCRDNAKRRNKSIEFNITKIDIEILYYKQLGLCALTEKVMTYENGLFDISIDRINSSKGYTIDNIQLICNIINNIKSDLSNNELINLCKMIIKNN